MSSRPRVCTSTFVVCDGQQLITEDGRTFGPGTVVEKDTEIYTIEDPYGAFGQAINALIGHLRGRTTMRVNGEVIAGELKIVEQHASISLDDIEYMQAPYQQLPWRARVRHAWEVLRGRDGGEFYGEWSND